MHSLLSIGHHCLHPCLNTLTHSFLNIIKAVRRCNPAFKTYDFKQAQMATPHYFLWHFFQSEAAVWILVFYHTFLLLSNLKKSGKRVISNWIHIRKENWLHSRYIFINLVFLLAPCAVMGTFIMKWWHLCIIFHKIIGKAGHRKIIFSLLAGWQSMKHPST